MPVSLRCFQSRRRARPVRRHRRRGDVHVPAVQPEDAARGWSSCDVDVDRPREALLLRIDVELDGLGERAHVGREGAAPATGSSIGGGGFATTAMGGAGVAGEEACGAPHADAPTMRSAREA